MQVEVEEIQEVDPLRVLNFISEDKNVSEEEEKLDESTLLNQFLSFHTKIRRDLGCNVEIPEEIIKTQDENLNLKPERRKSSARKAKTKLKEGELSCRSCQLPFGSKQQRQNHEKNVHPKTNVLCDICGKVTDNRKHTSHMKVHTNLRNFECPICSKRFKGSYDLKRHVTDIHEHTSDFICDICNKKLRSKKSMRKHMIQFHISNLALKCPECQRPFGDKSRLTRHLKVHKRARGEFIEEVKTEECHICHKLFANSTHLKQHMGKHSSERTFKCSICPAAFNFHSSMRNHEKKVHEGKGRVKKKKVEMQ